MDTRDGSLYDSRETALAAGVPVEHIVEVKGPPAAVQNIARTYSELARLRATAIGELREPHVKVFSKKDQLRRKAKRKAERAKRRKH